MEYSLRLRIPAWCPKARVAVNSDTPVQVTPGQFFCEIRRIWKPADSITLDMPMPWRLVRGRKSLEGRAALMRGPLVYCIGTANNSELLQKYERPGELVLDPASLGAPVSDPSFRPGGLKVLAKAWPPEAGTTEAAQLDVVLTEFIDPSGITAYFRLPDLATAVDDELINKTTGQ